MGVPSRKMFGTPTTRPKTKRKSLVKKAGRQKRLGKDLVQVTGRGTIKAPGSPRRHKFRGTTVVPRGSQVKFTGAGAISDSVAVRKGGFAIAGGSDVDTRLTSIFGAPRKDKKITAAEATGTQTPRVRSFGEVKTRRKKKKTKK